MGCARPRNRNNQRRTIRKYDKTSKPFRCKYCCTFSYVHVSLSIYIHNFVHWYCIILIQAWYTVHTCASLLVYNSYCCIWYLFSLLRQGLCRYQGYQVHNTEYYDTAVCCTGCTVAIHTYAQQLNTFDTTMERSIAKRGYRSTAVEKKYDTCHDDAGATTITDCTDSRLQEQPIQQRENNSSTQQYCCNTEASEESLPRDCWPK